MNKHAVKNLLTDIRFWILLFFALRLIGIANAPLETGHNWRQSLTNMIARNFFEQEANLFYPTIDMAGEKTGIIGSEFPIFNYLIYLFYSLFGLSHGAGRLINLVVSSAGLWYFYRLVKNLLDPRTAFNATLVLSVSIWFAFSRKIMPDTFSVSLVIMGLYYAHTYFKKGGVLNLLLYFVLITLGVLSKIPALSLLAGLSVLLLPTAEPSTRKWTLFAAAAGSFLLVYAWYFYWVPHLLATYRYQLYFPKGIAEGLSEIAPLVPELLEKFYFSALHSYAALVFLVVGAVALFKNQQRKILLGGLAIFAVFAVFIVKTGAIFPLHNYYIIPFVPVMAAVAGYGLSRLPLKFQYVALVLVALEGIANQQHDFFIKESQLYKLQLEAIARQAIPENELIIINGGPSPQDIYFAHKKGWTVENFKLERKQFVDSLAHLGAAYLIIDQTNPPAVPMEYPAVYRNQHYAVYRLAQ